ncbi:uncharacterized protein BDR25DRAFT_256916 [Lindgomyces ingoldianus]|uniref:Uncharacterized protein n=1 Tax=Lindgomyces ingoldianus TaxID=673940 RepID=A0ACB6R3S3_9PLEO|nr:uncharacterized protein BDR25DRAFT_256916 [Lindgomyces ingoldianus]KAF2473908.1 hypothetical protein BDR25DRAFT_256916 [Lindgomyces ingoldianus]
MVRQLPPKPLISAGPTSAPPQRYLGETVVVNHYTGTDKLIPAIPGFRTSAAFLTSLSANLRITDDDLMPSPMGTPTTFRGSSSHYPLPPPSPLSFSAVTSTHNPYPSPAQTEIMSPTQSIHEQAPKIPTDGLPELKTYTAESEDDRVEGLRLVADSVAQQRQIASKMLILHPVNLALYFLVLAVLTQYMYKDFDDILVLGTTIGGITMTCLIAVRMATGGYLSLAEDVNWDWLGDDRLIVVKWGEEIIGALVLGWADDGAKKKGGRRRRGKALVRAWTVKLKYRGKGVGEGLLEEAVKVAGEKGADGIIFDRDHANSKRILPRLYNSFLDKREARAETALEKVADEKGNFRQRRSSPTWGSR